MIVPKTKFKIGIECDLPGKNIAQVRTYLKNKIWPDILAEIQTKIEIHFTSFGHEKDLLTYEMPGTDRFGMYPKFWIWGETTLTKTQLIQGVRSTLADIRDVIRGHVKSQGAVNLFWHWHIPWREELDDPSDPEGKGFVDLTEP